MYVVESVIDLLELEVVRRHNDGCNCAGRASVWSRSCTRRTGSRTSKTGGVLRGGPSTVKLSCYHVPFWTCGPLTRSPGWVVGGVRSLSSAYSHESLHIGNESQGTDVRSVLARRGMGRERRAKAGWRGAVVPYLQ